MIMSKIDVEQIKADLLKVTKLDEIAIILNKYDIRANVEKVTTSSDMVQILYSDGELVYTKGGNVYGMRNDHCISQGIIHVKSKQLKLKHKFRNFTKVVLHPDFPTDETLKVIKDIFEKTYTSPKKMYKRDKVTINDYFESIETLVQYLIDILKPIAKEKDAHQRWLHKIYLLKRNNFNEIQRNKPIKFYPPKRNSNKIQSRPRNKLIDTPELDLHTAIKSQYNLIWNNINAYIRIKHLILLIKSRHSDKEQILLIFSLTLDWNPLKNFEELMYLKEFINDEQYEEIKKLFKIHSKYKQKMLDFYSKYKHIV